MWALSLVYLISLNVGAVPGLSDWVYQHISLNVGAVPGLSQYFGADIKSLMTLQLVEIPILGQPVYY